MVDGKGAPRGAQGPAGTILRAGGKDGPQLIASRGKRWTDAAEELFLDRLAASCNVTLSAKACGFSREAIYARRRREPRFAQRWDEALRIGYPRLEAALVEAAVNTMEGRPPDPASPIPPMSARDAIAVLKLHQDRVHGTGRRPGWRGRPRSLAEVKASILKKLAALHRARGQA
ncbi:MAG TPA: hypothetical protein VMG08_17030 [Allosphingosinicella sp.]|nr:hypothetical protein [Allosphingosinicella sp.]